MAVGNPISLTDNVASRIISQIATESQTDFTISGGYRINAISVYRNGVRLVSGRDYSAADGSTVVLLSGASLSDVLEFHIFDDFRVADAIVSNASYQNIEGNLNIAGILTVTSLDLTSLTVSDSISIGGTLTYNDVTNVDSIGIITARTDLHVGAGLSVVGVSTLSGSVDLGSNGNLDTITATGRFDSDLVPSNDDERDIGSSSLEWRDLYIDGTGNIDTLVSGDGTFSTNLGIGTANPTNYGGAVKLALSSDGHTGLSIAAGTSSDSNIFFADGTAGDETYRGNIKYAHDDDSMRFSTAAEEKLRITSDGNIGIGTTNPSALLEIKTTNEAALYITDSSNANNAPYIRVLGKRSDGNIHQSFTGQLFLASLRTDQKIASGKKLGTVLFGGNHTNTSEANVLYAASIAGVAGDDFDSETDMPTDLVFYTGSTGRAPTVPNVSSGTERLRITSGGNIGINSTSPQKRLTIRTGTGNDGGILIKPNVNYANNQDRAYLIVGTDAWTDATTNWNTYGFQHRIKSNSAGIPRVTIDGANGELFTIRNDGNIGIGTDNPVGNLEIDAASTTDMIMLDVAGTNFARIGHNSASGTAVLDIRSEGHTRFLTNGSSEILRITSGGKLLVDHTASVGSGKLQVFTKTADGLDILSFDDTAADGGRLTFYRNRNTNYGSNTKVSDDDSLGRIDFRGMNTEGTDNYEIGASIRAEVDGDPGTGTDANDMPGRLMFFTTSNGTDNPTERVRITSSGNVGIGTDDPENRLHVYNAGNSTSTIDAVGGDALLKLRNSVNGNWSGINFIRERATGTNVTGGSIWMPSNTSYNGSTLYIQTQSASANAGQSGALSDNNGVRLKLASLPDGVGADSAFTVEVGSTEKFRVAADGSIGIGTTSPVTDVDISQKTGAVALPQGTTAQRPSGSSPYIRYNTTNSALEFYNGTDWVEIITDYFPTGSVILG